VVPRGCSSLGSAQQDVGPTPTRAERPRLSQQRLHQTRRVACVGGEVYGELRSGGEVTEWGCREAAGGVPELVRELVSGIPSWTCE
jgi:hypothetical protein